MRDADRIRAAADANVRYDVPPFAGDDSALVLIDFSGWTHRSFHGSEGVDGMMSILVGWLTKQILAYRPAHLAVCLDEPGETFRHKLRHPNDENWRYKAGRTPKPDEFYRVSEKFLDIVCAHNIPALWCVEREADDVIATATARARAAGYRVWINSADKDIHGLAEADAEVGIVTGIFDHQTFERRGPAEVVRKFGVEPFQVADYLAIAGDGSDSVPGVAGLGPDKAAKILRTCWTLEDALSAPAWSDEKLVEIDKQIKKTPAGDERERLKADKSLAKWIRVLHEHADVARFSRQLTALDCDCSMAIPWEDLPVGGFDVAELKKCYSRLGFAAKAAQVEEMEFAKPVPWAVPRT